MTMSDQQRASALETLRGENGAISAAQRSAIQELLAERADPGAPELPAAVAESVEIWRDERGIPHIRAQATRDLFFAHGYVQAQDRLWQLDYMRRQALGRLSEIFGESKLEEDRLAHTLHLPEVSQQVYEHSSDESRMALDAFAAGVNAFRDEAVSRAEFLPIEFALLDYLPDPWSPVDSIAILRRWYWYLTGRLGVITTPEAVRAGVGDGERYEAFFAPDGPLRYIVPQGNYEPDPRWPGLPQDPLSPSFWGQTLGEGSNNWAVSSDFSQESDALLASDPHVYYTVPADWYEAHLSAPSFESWGMTYPGCPATMFGRGPRFAWGITNNICLMRDLYFVDQGEPIATSEPVEIAVRDAAPVQFAVRSVEGRPIVDHLVPAASLPHRLFPERYPNPTSLALEWVGFRPSDEIRTLLDFARAESIDEGREALRVWGCPTWNFVLADANGDIGYQASGFLPLRGREVRGYRSLHDPADAWVGFIPFEGLPRIDRPARGWVASANNPTAPPDFPYPLFGTWAPEDRAARAEDLLAATDRHSLDGFETMQNDVFSGRAERGLPGLLRALEGSADSRVRTAIEQLTGWDHCLTTESVAASLFYVFFWRWHQTVIARRFPEPLVPLVRDAGWGLSSDLLHRNVAGWYDDDPERIAAIQQAFGEALDWLTDRFGPDQSTWAWGGIHRLGAVHPAARTPLQHEVLDIPAQPAPGGAGTLANAFYTPPGTFDTRMGASYRMVTSMGAGRAFRSITWPGQSGHPGSPHYADQAADHLAGRFVDLVTDWETIEATATLRTTLLPA